MNILLFADDNYFLQLKTTLLSLFKNNKKILFKIFIFGVFSLEHKKKIRKYIEKHKSTVDFTLSFPPTFKKHFTINDKTNIFLNKFIFFTLPQDIDRILYLDCDLIINSSIKDFYQTDFKGKTIVVTKDLCLDWGSVKLPNGEISNDYFNAGVLLINLDSIRNKYSLDDIDFYLKKYRGSLPNDDQDILNMIFLHDKIVMDDRKYNYCIRHRDQSANKEYKHCSIFHYYYQNNKPWKYSYYNRHGFKLYWKYAWHVFGVLTAVKHFIVYAYKINRFYYLGKTKNVLLKIVKKQHNKN